MHNQASSSEPRPAESGGEGFECYTASLIVVSGAASGEEHLVERAQWLVGRGPDVDAAFDDPEMSQRHLRIEFSRGRFHAIDLDSTNGTRVNGVGVEQAELAHGDRIQAGAHVFQILIERNETRPWPRWSARGYVVSRIQ
jgi:pSer/pThr/pTyr-binding forkhead associated (FHA) protein